MMADTLAPLSIPRRAWVAATCLASMITGVLVTASIMWVISEFAPSIIGDEWILGGWSMIDMWTAGAGFTTLTTVGVAIIGFCFPGWLTRRANLIFVTVGGFWAAFFAVFGGEVFLWYLAGLVPGLFAAISMVKQLLKHLPPAKQA